MIELRDYQVDALDAADQAEREGVRRPLVVHPTGTGKGVVMGGAAKRRADRGRTIVLVHRKELADQFIEKLSWQAPELETGIVKATRDELDKPVVVASVDTVKRDERLARLVASDRRSPFGTVLVDEAHHAPAPGWTKVLKALGSFSAAGPLTIGFTATPERAGGTLGVWEKVVSYMSIREAIYRDFLCPILPAQIIETPMDLDRVRKTGGDFSDGSLGDELENSGAIPLIADGYVEHARDRKGVAFTPNVRTAHLLADALTARGIPAAALDGTTPDDERAQILADLKSGAVQVVCNCGVLIEGFDEGSIDCVLIARATVLHNLYVQMVGRGTRKHPGKKNLLVLDATGASRRHELANLEIALGPDLDGKGKKKDPTGEGTPCPSCGDECNLDHHRCSLCHRYLPKRVVAEGGHRHNNCDSGKAGQIDVFGTSRFRWLPVEDGWCLGAGKEIVVMVPAGPDTWRLASYENGRVKVLHSQLPADWATGIAEDRAKAFQKLIERDARWLAAPATDIQKGRLMREGLPESALPRVRTKGDAADLITRISGRRAVKKLRA